MAVLEFNDFLSKVYFYFALKNCESHSTNSMRSVRKVNFLIKPHLISGLSTPFHEDSLPELQNFRMRSKECY